MGAKTIALSGLNGNNGFRLDGRGGNMGFQSGRSVASAGDVNGDGFDDIIIGDPAATDLYSYAGQGESYIVYGKAGGFAASLDLGALSGVVIRGSARFDRSGYSVSSAGDINGDGFADVIVGAPQASQDDDDIFDENPYAGEASIVLGSASPAGLIQLSPGAILSGNFEDGEDNTGFCVAPAGDVNGDGFDDMILSAPSDAYDYDGPGGANKTGDAYVVFGRSNFAPFNLESLNGVNGFKLHGGHDGAFRSVASAGDVNGDGFDDVIVGAYNTGQGGIFYAEGTSYIVFGKSGGFGATLNLTQSSTLNGANGFRVTGADMGDDAGWSVASAGDMNGDGFDDILIGSRNAELSSENAQGETYVVFGGTAAYLDALHGSSGFDLSRVNGANGLRLRGVDAFDQSGWAVSSAGDFNGDGYDDILIGAKDAANNAGETYLVFGGSKAYLDALHGASGFDLQAINGANGILLVGISAAAFDYSGAAVASAGDINSDGFDDILIGAYGATAGGESYLVFGRDYRAEADFLGTANGDTKTGGNAADIMIGRRGGDVLNGGSGGDRISGNNGNDALNGGAGNDFMRGGLGNDTYTVGQSGDLVSEASGEGADTVKSSISYILPASVENLVLTGAVALNGTGNASANVLTGNNANNILNGGAGADTLMGMGGADTLVWGVGDRFDGGSGTDTLLVKVGNADLTGIAQDRLVGIEQVDLLAGAHTLKLAAVDVLDMSPTDQIRILGDVGDTVNIDGEQGAGMPVAGGFTRYTIGGAILIIDSDIMVL